MTAADNARRQPKHLTELSSVYELLDEIRLRPGMWLRGSSLQHLDSMLIGYQAAMTVHDIEEDFPFWRPGNEGPFTEWLWQRLALHSSLDWAAEIEREAQDGAPAVELFFSLFDEHRRERHPAEG